MNHGYGVMGLFFVALMLLSACTSQPAQQNTSANATPAPPASSSPGQPAASCADSDNGLDSSVAGTVTTDQGVFRDSCSGTDAVIEYYCDNKAASNGTMYCQSGFECENGACAKPAAQPAACADSDSGLDPDVPGSVSYGGKTYTDVCQGAYDVLEYYCENDSMKQKPFSCGAGSKCENGACVELARACSETDANNASVAGTTTLFGGGMVLEAMTDSCVDNASRTEYSCENNRITSRTEACAGGTYCLNGACVPPCYKLGTTVKDRTGTYTDQCMDNTTFREYSCSGNQITHTDRACDYCFENQCLSSSDVGCSRSRNTTVLSTGSKVIARMTDFCLDYQTIQQYRCSGGLVSSLKSCARDQFCTNAACTDITSAGCYDSDSMDQGGIHNKTITVLTSNTSVLEAKEDECLNDVTVMEYGCAGDEITLNYLSCTGDDRCRDGACVYAYTCTETDGGSSLVPGNATLWDGATALRTERDACSDDVTVHEVACLDNRIVYYLLPCPAGTRCDSVDGSCK